MVANFNKKQKLEFKIAGVVFLIIIAILFFADIRIYQKRKSLTLQINSYKKQIADVEKSSKTLKDEIANSNNEEYIEKIAYEQLGVQKPGEKQVIFIEPQKTETKAVSKEAVWTSWFSEAWTWIKSKF
ncbi:MAG: septum formation initiator family protein [Candidatus Staskawiczbacteria bacterium]|nr:septum formation initiator family protein [Candidatus Staskawiczbacteria bacterium]